MPKAVWAWSTSPIDSALHRDVAVKFIRPDLSDNRESRELFLVEAEVTSRLEHPGVVPVYGLGQKPDGDPFYVMRFIQGETLDDAIKAYHEPVPPNPKEEEGGREPDPRRSEFASCWAGLSPCVRPSPMPIRAALFTVTLSRPT